ncbi:MAG: class I SAM-dependent methyltransferase, partial [Oscillospiraceae bacterium]|nr:class I SAM-dependent methyltransferase [Oscillospiraceae bacterium]
VYGVDEPTFSEGSGLVFVREHEMTPEKYIEELRGAEKYIFKKLYAGGFSKKLYRLFEYEKV